MLFNMHNEANTTAAKLKDIPVGEYFKRKPGAKQIYKKGAYDKSTRDYECGKVEDISAGMYLKGSTVVHIGFTY
tara:strand:+ start:1738 stop:1959 length:222 start_codon:yes stop_codon:yes gene_type:complete